MQRVGQGRDILCGVTTSLPSNGLGLFKSLFTHFYDEEYEHIFSPMTTFWLMMYQRLNKDHTLDEAQQNVLDGGVNGLTPPGKVPPTRKSWHSYSTASYSNARKRLEAIDLEEAFKIWTADVAARISVTPIPSTKNCNLGEKFNNISVQLLDGTTFSAPRVGNIAETFSPAKNQHGESYWCQIRALAGFCPRSGILLSQVLGDQHISEQAQCAQLFEAVKEPTLFVGDSNFGVYSVLERADFYGHDLLTALTEMRALKILGDNKLQPGEECELFWEPGRADKLSPGSKPRSIKVRVLCQPILKDGVEEYRYFMTTLIDSRTYPIDTLTDLYSYRWLAEINFLYLKTQMDMDIFNVKSAKMATKEVLTGFHAYNMVRLAMWETGQLKGLNPLRLSFSRCARALLKRFQGLWTHNDCFARLPWTKFWSNLQRSIAKMGLPSRKKPRPNEPRKVRRRPLIYPALIGSREKARVLLDPG